jgi:tetratricopeptide (TPR) repeat protein
MKPAAILLLLSAALRADSLVLKDGRTLSGRAFVRQGDVILPAAGSGGESPAAAEGVRLTDIAKVECERPALLKNAPTLLAAGRISNVLVDIDKALAAAETYADLPGSHWPDLMVLKAHALIAAGSDPEADGIAVAMRKTRNPDLVTDSLATRALIAARKGDHREADSLLADLPKDCGRPGALAAAAVARGLGRLANQRFEEALKSFLELPVFLPDETALGGIALLGAARAFHGMEDYDRAISTLEKLIQSRPSTPEIPIARTLLPEWTRRRTVVREANQP